MLIIVGVTGAGKSTLARRIAASVDEDVAIVSAGGWVRAATGITAHGPEAYLELAAATQRLLAEDPERGRRWLLEQIDTCRPVIVEGCRILADVDALAKVRPRMRVINLRVNGLNGAPQEYQGVMKICVLYHASVVWRGTSRETADQYVWGPSPKLGAVPVDVPAALGRELLELWEGA